MIRPIAALLMALAWAAPAAAQGSSDPLEQARAQAQARRVPLLVDFQAPWCYSCYYMATHVMTGPEWERVRGEAVVLELDADSPEGAHWMQVWNVKVLPTYLVFDPQGTELGRLLGEQTRADFYGWLARTVSRADPLGALKARVTDTSPEAIAAAREVLALHHARFDAAAGLDWFVSLPRPVRIGVMRDPHAALWIGRLELQRAAAEKDSAACARAAEPVLAGNLGCERPYELGRVLACTADLPAAERHALLRPQAELMELLVQKRVLADAYRCADERSIVLGAADLLETLGDGPGEMLVLERAIVNARERLGDDLGRDRNLADNLRVYLDRAGRFGELDRLLAQLIAAYPGDYVYAYRQGKSLAARGDHERALPYFEQAALRAYGVNRLRNAELHARSLQALGRDDDARAVASEALRANGPWFPEDAARLKALVDAPAPAEAVPAAAS